MWQDSDLLNAFHSMESWRKNPRNISQEFVTIIMEIYILLSLWPVSSSDAKNDFECKVIFSSTEK